MKMFDVSTVDELSKLLAVTPFDIHEVLSKRALFYRLRRVPKSKSKGTFRMLQVPEGPLKLLQQKVKIHILDQFRPLGCVHGGVMGRSVMTNARPHVGKAIVFALDIKDFFPSVRPQSVTAIFEALGFHTYIAELLTGITTWNGQLPQGAPTSSSLANLSMVRVDMRVATLARRYGFAYTRYVDDLTLSGTPRLLDFRNLVVKIVEEEGFRINPLLTMHSGERQVVTGLVVNAKLNIPREKRTLIRRNVLNFSNVRGSETSNLHSIQGQISWVSSVNPVLGVRLKKRARLK